MNRNNVDSIPENQEDIIENNEELPQTNLDLEDKTRVIKGLILIFLFSSVVISSMVYYNAPNYNPNLVFEGEHDEGVKHHRHLHNNPVYRLQSRFSSRNRKNIK